jgi:predicted kinase
MERNLIIVRGLPGSGKSTFATLLGRAICTADDWFTDRDGNYNWNPSDIGTAHSWCKRKCRRFMEVKAEIVIVANTSTKETEITPYVELAKTYGYTVFSVIVENRHGGVNTHGVPPDVLKNMENRFSIKLI